VYCVHPLADKDGRTIIGLRNKAQDRAVSMEFSVKELPYVSLWKNTNAEGDGYVTGLEPGTNFPNNRRVERKFGRVPKLAAGASWSAGIDFTIQTNADEVKRLAERVSAIQGNTQPVLKQQAENKE
jgi:galactose mutarotase-like enzyme